MEKLKKILFFGSTGNSGKQVLDFLLSQNYIVHCSGRQDNPFTDKKVKYFKGDITESSFFKTLPEDYDIVINFAGVQPSILPYSENTDFESTMRSYIDINIKGVWNVLEYCRKNKIKKYIYSTSHRDIEGHWENGKFLSEDLFPYVNYSGDHAMYGISKVSGMMIGDYYGVINNMKVFNLRLPMIFSCPNKTGILVMVKKIIPFLKILNDAYNNRPLEVWGDPQMKRDYVHIDNLYYIINSLIQSNSAKSGDYNIGTGESVTTENFIKTIKDVFSDKNHRDIIYLPNKSTYKCTSYSIDNSIKYLNYKPILLKGMIERIKSELITKEAFTKWSW